MSQKPNSKPIKDFRAGNIQASIWRNDSQKDGRNMTRFTVRLRKRFRKQDGGYHDTEYLFPDDLPRVALVAQKAFEYTTLSGSKDSGESASP